MVVSVGRALVNLLLCLPAFIFGAMPSSPLLFIAIVACASPATLLGRLTSDDAVGLPRWWLRARSFPRVIPLILFWDLSAGIYMLSCVMVGTLILTPTAHVAFSLYRAICSSPKASTKFWEKVAPALPKQASEAAPQPRRKSLRHDEMSSEMVARYCEHASVWAAIEGGHTSGVRAGDVRLLSLSWLMDHAGKGGVLSRRQELPDEAFISAARLRQIEAGARWGTDLTGWRDDLAALGQGQGSSFFDYLKIFFGLFRRQRNVDRLLPIVSIS